MKLSENRHSRLPQFIVYKAGTHPKWPHGQAFVFQTTPEQLAVDYTSLKSLEIPQGKTEAELVGEGWLELQSTDAIFCRNLNGSGKAEDDFIKAFVLDKDYLTGQDSLNETTVTADCVASLETLRSKIIGDEVALINTGKTWFEQQEKLSHNRQGLGCFQIGITSELAKGIHHPAKNSIHDGDTGVLIKELNTVSTHHVTFLVFYLKYDRVGLLWPAIFCPMDLQIGFRTKRPEQTSGTFLL